MRRLWFVLLLLFCAFAAYASTIMTINPSDMKIGETKKLVDGDRTVTVTRNGNSVDVKLEGAEASKKLTITSGIDGFQISRDGGLRTWVTPPGADFHAPNVRSFRYSDHATQSWFVCPKDHTMLRVPAGKEDATYKCPVDGTTMEKRKGRGFAFFFDDSEADSL